MKETAPPIHLHQMQAIAQALTMANTADSNHRKLVLLQLFYGGGRGGEVARLNWNLADWDFNLGLLVWRWICIKTST